MDEYDKTLKHSGRRWYSAPLKKDDRSQDFNMSITVMPQLTFTPTTPAKFNKECALCVRMPEHIEVGRAELLGHAVYAWYDRIGTQEKPLRINIVFEANGSWHRYVGVYPNSKYPRHDEVDEDITQDVFNIMQGKLPDMTYASNETAFLFWLNKLRKPYARRVQERLGWVRYADIQKSSDIYFKYHATSINKPVHWEVFDDPVVMFLAQPHVFLVRVPALVWEAGHLLRETVLEQYRCIGAVDHAEYKVFNDVDQTFRPF